MNTWNDELFEEEKKFLERKRAELVREIATVDELLMKLQEHHQHPHPHHGKRLSAIALQFNPAPSTEEKIMNVTLTTAGQKVTASVRGLDQDGQPMAAGFQMPPVTFTGDNDAAATVTENADGATAEVTAVATGSANVNASVTSAEGKALSASGQVTVDIPVEPPPPPPAQVLTSIEVVFDAGEPVATEPAPPTEAPVDSNLTPNQKLAAALGQ